MALQNNKIINTERNCWRYVKADRAAILIDGESYFGALHAAISQARHSIYILAWDIDSRIRLLRGETTTDLPVELGELLHTLLMQRPELEVHILNWDWAMLYKIGRASCRERV